MYILFEQVQANASMLIGNYDCMGYTMDEKKAIEWVNANLVYRKYKYCPNKELL